MTNAVADIDRGMLRIGDDVSRLRVGEAANRATHSRLSTGVMRQGNAHLAVDILHETGAIPTGRGIAAGHIRDLADELVRECQQAGHAGPIRRRHGEGTAAAEVASSGGTGSGLGLCLSLGLLLTLLFRCRCGGFDVFFRLEIWFGERSGFPHRPSRNRIRPGWTMPPRGCSSSRRWSSGTNG